MHLAKETSEKSVSTALGGRLEPPFVARQLEVINGMSDADLVAAVAGGDSEAWETLIDRFGGMVWSVAVGHGLCESDANDVVQTTWLNLFTSIGSIRQPERVAGWLRTTARNESLGVLRRRGRTTPVEFESVDMRSIEADCENNQADPQDSDPQDIVMRAEGDPVLKAVITQLNEGCRRMLLMLVEDPPASYASVAEAVNVRLGTVGAKRKRCLDRLRSLYEAETLNREPG